MNDIKRASFVPAAAVVLVLSLEALTGCSKASTKTEPEAAAAADCDGMTAEFAAVRRRGSQACTSDADCACFNGLDPAVPCGGAMDAKTVAKLREIEKDFAAKSCKLSHQCAAQVCSPTCVAGQCATSKPTPLP